MLQHLLPEDLLRYGLIPEFVGRLPVITTLRPLDRDALVQILTEPKNALIKQYKKFFEYDGVDLQFTTGALEAIADEAIKRSTGARALRMIIEEVMRDIMYEIPSQKDIKQVILTEETIRERTAPETLSTDLRAAS
jgi:ATP-dependent Clp protease ATP-binding subunit ClpX